MSVKPHRSVSSVLARFEQTIELNNEAGVSSGMYLTSLAASTGNRSAGKTGTGRRMVKSAHSAPPPPRGPTRQRRQSEIGGYGLSIPKGSYRGGSFMLPEKIKQHSADATVSTAGMSSEAEWDPFSETTSSLHEVLKSGKKSSNHCHSDGFSDDSTNSEDTFGFDEEAFGDEVQNFDPFALGDQDFIASFPSTSDSPKIERKPRPVKEKRGTGRLGNRITKTKLEAEATRKGRVKAEEGAVQEGRGGKDDDEQDVSAAGSQREALVKDNTARSADGDTRRTSKSVHGKGRTAEQRDSDDDNGFAVTYVANQDSLSKQNSVRGLSSRRGLDSSSTHNSRSANNRASSRGLDASSTPSRSINNLDVSSTHSKLSNNRRPNDSLEFSSFESSRSVLSNRRLNNSLDSCSEHEHQATTRTSSHQRDPTRSRKDAPRTRTIPRTSLRN